MPSEPSYPHRDDMEVPLLRALLQFTGSIRFSVKGRQIEDILAEHFRLTKDEREFASPNYHSEGNRKWRNHIQFVRDQLVKKGELDNSRHDIWTVTSSGYKRLGLTPPPNAPDPPARPLTERKKPPPKSQIDQALELLAKLKPKE